MMKTIHIDPTRANARQRLSTLQETLDGLLDGDKPFAVTVAEEDAMVSPQEAADRLGFSRQHVRRLIAAGELEGEQMPNSTHWKIPLRSILAFEQRRTAAEERAAKWSRGLDAIGAPSE